jgi:hypothetical protein
MSPKATVTAKAADATLTVANFGTIITNTGAGATVTLTLPKAADCCGCVIKIQLTAAQIVRLLPVTGEKVYLGGSGVASKYLNIAAVIGNYADVFSDGEDFNVLGYSGVLTKEA